MSLHVRFPFVPHLLLLVLVVGITASTASAQIIPPDRLVDWDPGVRGGVPWVPYRVSVTDFGAVGDGVADDGPAFNDAIAAAEAPGFVWVPPGVYRIATVVQLADGVVLQGAGPSESRLLFDLPGFGFRGGIEIHGSLEAAETAVLGGFGLGSTEITLESTEGLAAGSLLWLFQDDDDGLMYTADYWRTDYSVHSMGQVVGITGVDGDTVTLEDPLRHDYRAELTPRVRVVDPIEGAGVEGLYLERLDQADAYTISISEARDCWVRWVESRQSYRSHVWAFYSSHLTIAHNYFHEAWDYGGGGHGYGVTLADCTSDVLVTNNIFRTLRHAMMAKEGANGNVFSYNDSKDNRQAKSDAVGHGHWNYANLFEGNDAEQAVVSDWWGPSGPRTTVFRNRLHDNEGVSVRDHSDMTNVVGNTTPRIEIRKGPDIILFGYPVYMGEVKDELVDGNLVDGVLEWNGDPAPIPASHYLVGPPDFWGALPWPAIGADVDLENEPDLEIPATRRLRAIEAGLWAPPTPEILTMGEPMAGVPVEIEVLNAEPGEKVFFLSTFAGTGPGPCFAGLGGLCVDLLDPGLAGSAIADAEGVARFSLELSPDDGGLELSVQAVMRRGEGGATSSKSNAATALVVGP